MKGSKIRKVISDEKSSWSKHVENLVIIKIQYEKIIKNETKTSKSRTCSFQTICKIPKVGFCITKNNEIYLTLVHLIPRWKSSRIIQGLIQWIAYGTLCKKKRKGTNGDLHSFLQGIQQRHFHFFSTGPN